MSGKTNRWIFTVNNEAVRFYENLPTLFNDGGSDYIRYICGQIEKAPTTGQLHFQGYAQFKKSQNLTLVRQIISTTGHFEPQRGSNDQARDYCRKADTAEAEYPFIEFGIFTAGQGQRNDLVEFKDDVFSGKCKRDLIHEYPMIMAKYHRFYSTCRELMKPAIRTDLKVRLNIGKTGTGKTRYAFDTYPDIYAVPVTNATLWFDGYDAHEEVLFDDFCGSKSKIRLDTTLRLFDIYRLQVPIKGGFVWFEPKVIIVTTNLHPSEWYDFSSRWEQLNALARRFTEVALYRIDHPPTLLNDQEDIIRFFNDNTGYINGEYYDDEVVIVPTIPNSVAVTEEEEWSSEILFSDDSLDE